MLALDHGHPHLQNHKQFLFFINYPLTTTQKGLRHRDQREHRLVSLKGVAAYFTRDWILGPPTYPANALPLSSISSLQAAGVETWQERL